MSRFRANDLQVSRKPDTTHVTEADHATETLIRTALRSARPDDAVLGEEYGSEGSSRRRWIVDPIDGTANYVRGVPIWATLIALEEDGELRVGVVSAPALHTRWHAARGEGAFSARDAWRCRTSPTSPTPSSAIPTSRRGRRSGPPPSR